jgi:spore maturation protein CgeB
MAKRHLENADVGMVTSYCPDGLAASNLVLSSPAPVRSFYDLDTPVTLARLRAGEDVGYIGAQGLGEFDVVFSYTGGPALTELQSQLGARRVLPLYGSVDPQVHKRVPPSPSYVADLSYLGTYAADRQPAVQRLLIEPARRLPHQRFLIGGAQYPTDFPWTPNIYFVSHLPPAEHPAFYSSCRLTLNVTRAAMADMGYCPSGRLFEAAACGTPILSDWWEGLDTFFEPGKEILIAHETDQAVAALERPLEELWEIGRRARERALREHTAERRASELETALTGVLEGRKDRELATAPLVSPGFVMEA